jgi:hypothetical protein
MPLVSDALYDLLLNAIKNNGLKITICSQAPTTYTEANATYSRGSKVISSSDFTGPANGDVSGRKLAVNAIAGISVSSSGNVTHVAIVDTSNTNLLIVSALDQAYTVTSGGSVNTAAFDVEILDAA